MINWLADWLTNSMDFSGLARLHNRFIGISFTNINPKFVLNDWMFENLQIYINSAQKLVRDKNNELLTLCKCSMRQRSAPRRPLPL